MHTVYLRVELEGAASQEDAAAVVAAALDTGVLHDAVKDNEDVKARVMRVTCEADLGRLLEWPGRA